VDEQSFADIPDLHFNEHPTHWFTPGTVSVSVEQHVDERLVERKATLVTYARACGIAIMFVNQADGTLLFREVERATWMLRLEQGDNDD
jgi:hypothetical protein